MSPINHETVEEKLKLLNDVVSKLEFANQRGRSDFFDDTFLADAVVRNLALGVEIIVDDTTSESGGCLIATATFSSELAPQVQQLRELRDNTILTTKSGNAFMTEFNQFYYSFSPAIADLERENPIFKEAIKITLTPLLASLSILNHVDMDSEESVLGYGISLIILNVGLYFVIPFIAIIEIKRVHFRFSSNQSR